MLNHAPATPQRSRAVADKTGVLSDYGVQILTEMWKQVAPGFPVVPCKITGTNALTLTPTLTSEGGVTYGDGMVWSGVAAHTSTGAVTASVGSLPAVKVFKNAGASQAGAGDIVAGSAYVFIYESALDSGNGGLVLVGGIGAVSDWTAYTPVITASAGAFTTVSATGRWAQINKVVFVQMTITITTNGTAGSQIIATLPTTANSTATLAGRELDVTGLEMSGTIASGGTTVGIQNYANGYPGGSGYRINLSGSYETQ